MMFNIEELIRKYNRGECSAEEKQSLEQWYNSFEWNDRGSNVLENDADTIQKEIWLSVHDKITADNRGKEKQEIAAVSRWGNFRILAAAAAIIFAFITIVFFISKPGKEKIAAVQLPAENKMSKAILPGTSKAQLVLADGSVISLDSAKTMQFTEADGTAIDKQAGRLAYKDNQSGNGKILFNTLSTPRGGEYQLELPDGSRVWLNAASSIKFPTRFEGSTREVFLKGEAYFEVAKNKAMPFHVRMDNDMVVEVLGTHFNIMAYNDESDIQTTLEEGSVKVSHSGQAVFLTPSRQAVLKRENKHLTAGNCNLNKALAWKNGMIEFDGDHLPYIMRQLARWYDVDIVFTNSMPRGTYKGAIPRQAPLADVLEILKLAGVQFKMDNKKLVVTGG